jgi:hypothetical protein
VKLNHTNIALGALANFSLNESNVEKYGQCVSCSLSFFQSFSIGFKSAEYDGLWKTVKGAAFLAQSFSIVAANPFLRRLFS